MGWFLSPKEGNFYLGIVDDDHIHVITQTSKHLIYSLDGELISDVAIDSSEEYHHLVKRYSCLETTDNAGILYKIVSRIWHPTILKCPSIATNQILVKDEYWRWSLGTPFPSLVYSCIAMLLCILFEKLKRDKTKKADNFEVN
jgi:hypothetical protein